VAACVIEGIAAERFLMLPHAVVGEYFRRKGADYDRWLAGMRRLRSRYETQGVARHGPGTRQES
jgi:hypothetical protein